MALLRMSRWLFFAFLSPAPQSARPPQAPVSVEHVIDCIILEEYRLWYCSNGVFYIDSLSLVVLLLLAGQHRFEAHPIVFSHNSPTPKRIIDKYVMTDEEKKDEVVVNCILFSLRKNTEGKQNNTETIFRHHAH